MKKEKESGAEITPIPKGVITKQETEELDTIDLSEIQPTAEELSEIKDEGYLETSTSVVGFANRSEQHSAYAEIVGAIAQGSSILDFGCGRGDFFAWHEVTFGKGACDYLGVDANETLIETGNKIYDDVNLIWDDWNNLTEEDKKDWCINIRSNNLRYDAQLEMSDSDYVMQTIDKMFDLCNVGLIISLSSDKFDVDGQIKYNAGEIMSRALSKYDFVAVDHTTDTNQFLVIIYKK